MIEQQNNNDNTVKIDYNELQGDRQNLFVITGVLEDRVAVLAIYINYN
jgi:hypothetical protein